MVSRKDYRRLEQELLRLGFREAPQDGVICRWVIEDVLVDVMPTDAAILGFTNSWYVPALQAAERVMVSDTPLRVVSGPYFFATKLEAYRSRGEGDFSVSPDIADIVAIVDGRKELVDELAAAPDDVREFAARELEEMLDRGELEDAVSAHLRPDQASQARAPIVLHRLRQIIAARSG